MNELFHQPGFLGTAANWAADITLVLSVLVGLAFTVGAILMRLNKFTAHRWVQTGGWILNVILVIWMMLLPYRDFIAPGIPDQLNERFHLVTTIHAIVGFFAFVFGGYTVIKANYLLVRNLRFRDHFKNVKLLMRVIYVLYMTTTLLGIWVYFVWFVNNPNPPVY